MIAERVRAALSYDPSTGEFVRLASYNQYKAGQKAGYVNKSSGYVYIDVLGKTYSAHRLAWLHVNGRWPEKTIDHINGVRHDNRIANLRDISQSGNNRNKAPQNRNTSGVPGVYWHKPSGRWMSLGFSGGQKALGYRSDWFEAVCLRKSWEARTPIE